MIRDTQVQFTCFNRTYTVTPSGISSHGRGWVLTAQQETEQSIELRLIADQYRKIADWIERETSSV